MRTTEFQIKDVTFYVDKFRARQGFIILGDLQKELMPILGGFFNQAEGGDELQAFVAASSGIDSRLLEKWMDILITPDTVSYEKPGQRPQKISKQNFDDAFEDFTDIAQLLFEIIKLNFAGPLVQWLGHIGPGLNMKAENLLGSFAKS